MATSTSAVMWFRRDLRLGDNPALLEAAADGDVLPLFVLDPALWGPAGPVRRAYLAAVAAGPGHLAAAAAARLARSRRPGGVVVLAAPRGRRRTGCTSPPTSARTAAPATQRVETALAEHGTRPGAHRLAVRRGAGPGDQGRRRRRTGSTRRSTGPGPSTAGAPRRAPRRACPGCRSRRPPGPRRRPAGRAAAARGRRAAAARARWDAFLDERLDRLRRRPRPARPDRHLAHVGAPEVGRDPPAHAAGRPRPADAARRTRCSARSWPGGSSTPTCCSARPETAREYLRPEFAAMPYDDRRRPTQRFEAWREGRTGFPFVDAGMRQLLARGLDAQPGADGRRDLPRQGPAPAVAARRAVVHAVAARRRPRQQPARLAVDGGLRHRRGAVLPGVQPAPQGRKFDPDGDYVRRWVEELADPRAVPTRTSRTGGYAAPSATPTRSSTTRRSVRRRWTGGRRYGDDDLPESAGRPAGPPPLLRPAVLGQRRLDRRRARRADRPRLPRGPGPVLADGPGRAAPAAAAGHPDDRQRGGRLDRGLDRRRRRGQRRRAGRGGAGGRAGDRRGGAGRPGGVPRPGLAPLPHLLRLRHRARGGRRAADLPRSGRRLRGSRPGSPPPGSRTPASARTSTPTWTSTRGPRSPPPGPRSTASAAGRATSPSG